MTKKNNTATQIKRMEKKRKRKKEKDTERKLVQKK